MGQAKGKKLLGWTYGYDPLLVAQRTSTRATVTGLPGWGYGYNNRGEVTAAVRTDGGGEPVAGQEWGYSYDSIGNRLLSSRGIAPAAVYSTIYSANELNQYEGMTHPDALEVSGLTAAGVPQVQVNGQPPTGRPPGNGEPGGFALWVPRSAGDDPSTNWLQVTTTAQWPGQGVNGSNRQSSWSGYSWLPPAAEAPQYDLDGNLTQDAKWTYTWDAENRLIAMQMRAEMTPPQVPLFRAYYGYDGLSRRVVKSVERQDPVVTSTGQRPGWVIVEQREFIYEGWNVIGEMDSLIGSFQAYAWGSDLSGTLTGAGGVGGLLGIATATRVI